MRTGVVAAAVVGPGQSERTDGAHSEHHSSHTGSAGSVFYNCAAGLRVRQLPAGNVTR